MKTYIIIIVWSIVSLLCLTTFQQCPAQSALKIGDDIPEMRFINLINYSSDSLRLHELRGKVVILYFWNEGCTESMHTIPTLTALQAEFREDLAIILVNDSQSKSEVRRIYKDQERFRKVDITLPTICDDRSLLKFFPRASVPHIIWIDRDMKLMSVTRDDQINASNIAKLVNGEDVNMPVKDGVKYKVDFSRPLYLNGNGGNGDHIMFYSVLSSYYSGLHASTNIDSTYGFISNTSVVHMIRYLFKSPTNRFGAQNFLPVSRLKLEVDDPARYAMKVDGRYKDENIFTYQLVAREPQSPDLIRAKMLIDLKTYFRIDCYWSKAVKECLVLQATDTTKLAWKTGDTIAAISDTSIELNNISVQEMIENILAVTAYHHAPYPWVDETGFRGMLGGIKIKADIEDWQELAGALRSFGLRLVLEKREVPILVVYEVDHHNPPVDAQIAN